VHERDLIIFVTVVVIVLIMLVQGTTLPAVVSWARLMGDREREDEVRWARIRATEAALDALPQVAAELGASPDTVDRLRTDYQDHLADFRSPRSDEADEEREMTRRLRLGVLDRKRQEITRLRNRNEIDDVVLRQLQAAIDIEEIRLLGPEPED
jgi:monovalent cation/hydrogen antiporter